MVQKTNFPKNSSSFYHADTQKTSMFNHRKHIYITESDIRVKLYLVVHHQYIPPQYKLSGQYLDVSSQNVILHKFGGSSMILSMDVS